MEIAKTANSNQREGKEKITSIKKWISRKKLHMPNNFFE